MSGEDNSFQESRKRKNDDVGGDEDEELEKLRKRYAAEFEFAYVVEDKEVVVEDVQ